MTTIEIRVLAHIRDLIGKKSFSYSFESTLTVQELIIRLSKEYDLEKYIYKSENILRDDVRILLQGRDIQFLNSNDLILKEDDIVLIMPVLAGG